MWLYEKPIAHRGLHDSERPENSMAAFISAAEHGYTIETDVHLLSDGNIACHHDKNVKRMTGKDIDITELSLVHLDGKHYRLPNGERIPLLPELIALAEEKGIGLLIEIKSDSVSRKILRELYKVIKGKESFIAVQCFSPFAMNWFSSHGPEFQRGLLATGYTKDFVTKLTDFGYDTCGLVKLAKPDFIAYNVENLPSATIAKLVKKFNCKLLAWTVNTDKKLQTAKECNVDNVIFETLNLTDGYTK